MQWVYVTGLLVGTMTSIATAQTVTPEISPSPARMDDAIANDSQAPIPKAAELDLPPRTLSEAGFFDEKNNPQTPPAADSSLDIAQTPETNPDDNSVMQVQPRIGAQFTTGPGVGYESSFGGVEGFIPLRQTPAQNLTFLEGRLLVSTDDGQLGGNLLVGHRLYNAKTSRTIGGYVAYDIRDTGDSVFNQLGAGLETLGETWDARVNAYIPIGDTRQQTRERINNVALVDSPVFQGNSLVIGQQQLQIDRQFDAALTGVDVEGGVKIAQLGETGQLRGYAGLYYYDGPNTSSFVGGRLRLEARPTDTLRAGLSLETDGNFGTRLLLNVGANFPGTRPRGVKPQQQVLARLGDSIVRSENIAVDEQSEFAIASETLLATNPSTGEPWSFRHVNLGIGTGNGTAESPTGTVAQALAVAQPNEIVYVQTGTNPGIPAFTIPDGVQVLSTGPVQQIPVTGRGNVQLPLSGSGVRPSIVGTVTLGNNNTLSGFEINGASGSGIRGTGINNTSIRDNIIRNSTRLNSSELGQGILLTNVGGTIDITNNTITQNADNAISVSNNTGQVNLLVERNAIANNLNAIRFGISGSATGTAQITNNSIANSGSLNIQVAENAQLSNLTISDNTIDRATAQGIYLQAFDNAQATMTVSNNTLSNITGDGVLTGDGMRFALNQNSQLNLLVSGNTITTTSDDGIDFDILDSTVSTVTISNNQIFNANSQGLGFDNFGIEVDADNNAQLQLLIESNTITGSGNRGISIFAGGTGGSPQVSTSIRLNDLRGNNVSSTEVAGFEAVAFGGSTICLQLRDNRSEAYFLGNNSGTFQAEVGGNIGVIDRRETTSAPPFVGCTVP